jgi:aldehyde dehydrogenase (NAD+)
MNSKPDTAAGIRLYRNLIDGKFCDAADQKTVDCLCPSDGQIFAAIPRSGEADIHAAVLSARKAFESGPWGRMTATERGRVLLPSFLSTTKNLRNWKRRIVASR